MTSMPTKFTGMMRTGGGLPPTQAPNGNTGIVPPMLPPGDPPQHVPMRTGGPNPPVPAGQPMRTGGGLPPVLGSPNGGMLPSLLYRATSALRDRMGSQQAQLNRPSPDAGRAASDGNTPNMPKPAGLPPGTEFKAQPVSATGMPSQPPGRVGRPAGGLFRGMMGG